MAANEVISACAILPAGGTGERFGTQTPKQFCSLLGRPLVSYTLEAFERVKWIQHVVLVVPRQSRAEVEKVLRTYRHNRVSLAEGRDTRHGSIYSGIQALQEAGFRPDIVVIHDAVRPFVDQGILEEVSTAAQQHGAAGATRPLVSTVLKAAADGFLDVSLDRTQYRASEMPQAFRFDVIHAAYQRCSEYDFKYGTECLHLAQKYGGAAVKLIEGDSSLWKVTHWKDTYTAEGMLREKYNKVVMTGLLPDKQLQNELMTAMKARNLHVSCKYDGMLCDSPNYIACVDLIQPEINPDDLEKIVLDLSRGRHPATTSGVILLLFPRNGDGENPNLSYLKLAVQRIAHQLQPQGMYLNLVIIPPCYNVYLRPLPELVAELAFQRSLIFSGQTFYARLP